MVLSTTSGKIWYQPRSSAPPQSAGFRASVLQGYVRPPTDTRRRNEILVSCLTALHASLDGASESQVVAFIPRLNALTILE